LVLPAVLCASAIGLLAEDMKPRYLENGCQLTWWTPSISCDMDGCEIFIKLASYLQNFCNFLPIYAFSQYFCIFSILPTTGNQLCEPFVFKWIRLFSSFDWRQELNSLYLLNAAS